MLLAQAYGIDRYDRILFPGQPSGAFEVKAKVPAGTTRAEFQEMLRHLLEERFHLAVHRETRPQRIYQLAVVKGGPKLRASPDTSNERGRTGIDPDGFPYVAACDKCPVRNQHGLTRTRYYDESLDDFCLRIAPFAGGQVVNMTGLEGRFDFTLTWDTAATLALIAPAGAGQNSDSGPGGDTLFEAVRAQLGLQLAERKSQVEFLVVDHADKTPVSN